MTINPIQYGGGGGIMPPQSVFIMLHQNGLQ